MAPQIHQTLLLMQSLIGEGHACHAVELVAATRLERAGFVPDYTAIRRADDLGMPEAHARHGLVALIAARLGSTRLIDNLPLA